LRQNQSRFIPPGAQLSRVTWQPHGSAAPGHGLQSGVGLDTVDAMKGLFGLLACLGIVGLATAARAETRFILVSHAPDSDSWWNTIKNAIKQAGEDFGVAVDYRNPPGGDLADMARILEQASARNYDGVITTIANIDILKKPIAQIVAKKIPLVTIDSGTIAQSEELGAIMHVGQSEYDAGKAAGERTKAAGAKSFLCVNHYVTTSSSVERCKGFGDALGVDYESSMIDSGDDPTTVESKVSGYLRKHPTTAAVLTLGPSSAHPTLKAIAKLGLKGKIFMATFDLSPEISAGIKDGTVALAIDEQPYLRGYIPVAVLAIMKQQNTRDLAKVVAALKANPKAKARFDAYGLAPVYGARHISSGLGFVTKDNIAKVEKLAGKYR
jgi:simple sugar transport system substrate-binding protein